MQTISLKLPEFLLKQLENEARSRQVTKSQLIREGLERILEPQSPGTKRSCYELAEDLAGSLKNLPKDLSNNPEYLKTFGR